MYPSLSVTFSEILGLMEVKLEIKIFAFSKLFVFWEEISKSENEIPQKYYFKFAES